MQIETLQTDIEQRLATAEPEVEVLACEDAGHERVRLFIDHPDGVDLALCERVTSHLRDVLVAYGLEVSSPGPERPLSKPDHFRRFLGRRARVRLRACACASRGTATRASPGSSSAPVTRRSRWQPTRGS
jgi:ribosome maturation factor RimP